MVALVESIPNFSKGRRIETGGGSTRAICGVDGMPVLSVGSLPSTRL
jgi:hypothetical protein